MGIAQPAMGPPGYAVPPPRQVAMMQQRPMFWDLGNMPRSMMCPNCQLSITTEVDYAIGTGGWIWCLGWSCCTGGTCSLCIGMLSCCVDQMQDAYHRCPRCNASIGIHKFLC